VDNVAAWPRDGEKYLPIETREFEALVAAANRGAAGEAVAATIVEARYSARLEGDRLVAGQAEWEIELHGEAPLFLSLGKMSIFPREPHWRAEHERPNESKSAEPALLGMWGASGEIASEWGLEVARSGVLEFNWHALPIAAPDGIFIEWRMPAASSTRLVLDLPEGKLPSIDGGVIVESRPLAESTSREGGTRWRWEIAVAGSVATTLRIADVDGDAAAKVSERSLRENLTYQLTERGLEIEATLQFDEFGSELRELVVPLPPGGQLVSATYRNQELKWHVASTGSPEDASAIVAIPAEPPPVPLTIKLRAWQPLLMSQPWQLPKLRPMGVLWIAGAIDVAVAPTLELQRLSTVGCQQSDVIQPDGNSNDPWFHSFNTYSANASVTITVAPQKPEATVRAASSLALAETDVNGRLISRLRVARGNLHTLSGELAPGWTIEAVETDPPDALGEWFVDRKEGRSKIEIQLNAAAVPTQDLTIIATGRLQRTGLTQALSAEILRMVRWRDVRLESHRLTFQTVEPYVVEPIGGLPLLKMQNAAVDQLTEFDATDESGPRFDLTAPPAGAALRVAVKRGQYEADVWVDATFVDNELRQEFHVVARPRASHIDRLLVYVTQPLGEKVQWSERSSGIPLAAERLTMDSRQQANVPGQGEAWLVRLPNPTGKPVEIVAWQNVPWSERKPLPLISVPEAVEQNGRVHLRGSIQHRPVVEANQLRAIPMPLRSETAASAQRAPVMAAYRYDPSDCLSPSDAPKLWIAAAAPAGLQDIIARRAEIESFFMLDGRGIHRVNYYLEQQGSRRLSVRLPADVKLRSLAIDGHKLEVPADGHRAEGVVDSAEPIPLPLPREKESILSAYFETRAPRPRPGRQLQPPLLDLRVPLLAGTWTIWLPAEFSAVETGSTPLASALHVRQRLFGPLGRPSAAIVYNPFGSAAGRGVTPGNDIAGETASEDAGVEPAVWFQEFIPPIVERDTSARIQNVAMGNANTVSLPGWQARQFSFVSDRPAAVTVTRPTETLTWSIAVFLACAAMGRSLWRRRREAFVGAIAIAAASALLLPETISPLATGAFMGLVSSLLVIWPGRPLIEESPTKTWNRSAAARLVVLVSVCLSTLLSGAFAQAQTTGIAKDDTQRTHPTVDERSNRSDIHRVLIPTDANGDAAGSKTYVSERFLRRLHQASATDAGRRWILLGADYQVELRDRADAADVLAGECNMMLSIAVLARDTTVVLPVARDEATWQSAAIVDGVPAPLVWSEDGRGCSIEIEEPGRHELVITCVPRLKEENGRNQIQFSIPPILGARVRVRHPDGLSTANVSVSGKLLRQVIPSEGEFFVELDGTDLLRMTWPRVSADADRTPGLRVTTLEWLRIGVEAIELDTKYIVESDAQRPDSITILADKRWELQRRNLPAEVASQQDGQQTIRISLPVENVDRREISLRWRLADAPVLGRFRLPPVTLASLPETQRWLAISSASALKFEAINSESASAATANEFLALWGAAFGTIPPDSVLADVQTATELALAIEPRTAASTVDDLLHVAAGNDGLRIQYDATMVPAGIHEFQFPLDVSTDVAVDEVKLSAAGRQIPLRWSRDPEGVLTIFFSQRLSEQYEITVSGHVPANEAGNYAVPRIGAVGIASNSRVQLFRTGDVEIELTGLDGNSAATTSPLQTPPSDWRGMAAGAFVVDSALSPSLRIVVTANRVEADGNTHTLVSRDAEGWWATFNCHLKVQNGRMDSLKLLAPSTWRGPIEIKSTVPASLEAQPRDERQTATSVRFAKPIEAGENLDLELKGRLATEAGSTLAVPPIVPEAGLRGPRFLSVPASLDSQPMFWSETGVRQAELPRDLPPLKDGNTKWATYEVVSDTFQVVQRPAAFGRRMASVRLADTFVNVGPIGDHSVLTRMVVVSQGLPECTLELPKNQELLQVLTDGHPADVRPSGSTRWRLALGPSHLPQFIEILSRSTAQQASALRLELSRPRLVSDGMPLPVEMSFWSFNHLANRDAATISGADRVTGAQQAASRLDRLVSISEAATSAAIEAPFPDGYNWYQPWAARLVDVRQEVSREDLVLDGSLALQVGATTEELIAQASERLDAWLETCDSALTWADPAPPIFDEGPPAATPPMELTSGQWIHGVAEGGDPVIYVELASSARPLQTRGVTLVLVVAAAAASVSLMRRPAAWDVVCRWPHAASFLLGIAYWAVLWPSWLGIVIAIASLFLGIRTSWPGRTLRSDGSTVLRFQPR
jgi:hypothetical protein